MLVSFREIKAMLIDLETKRIGASASFGTVDRLGRASGIILMTRI
ncbi:unnamed protein product [Rhodiola kirilowii]